MTTQLAAAVCTIQSSLAGPALIVSRLNDAWMQAYLESDADAFGALLADDFVVTLSNGRVMGREPFIDLMTQPAGVSVHRVEDLCIRVYRDSAVVTATTVFISGDGSEGRTRYTDVYVQRSGVWRAVAAHLTSVQEAIS